MLEPMALGDELKALQANRRLPPVAQWHPQRVGRIDIHIDAEGVWRHEGASFRRPALMKLFASILRKEADGYYLVTPQEKFRIMVEDAPFLAVECQTQGEGAQRQIRLRTTADDVVSVDAQHPVWVRNGPTGPRPYVRVREGLNALIARPLYYQLVDLGEEADGRLWLTAGGARFDLGATR